jgi:glyoxylase-like metal-dependent hydrolase (beta-lactamase superfamily II)
MASGVFAYEVRGAFTVNTGIVVGDDGVAIIDTGTTEADARDILQTVGALTDQPVRYVINTHHHGDHSFGNWWFLPAVVIGHTRCRLRLVGDAGTRHRDMFAQLMPMAREAIAAVPVVAPSLTFEQSCRLQLGEHALRLDYLGRAHTDNDIAITAEQAAISFAGDLIEQAGPPVAFEAFPAEWGPTLRRLAARDASTFLPGHGRPVDRAFVEAQATAFEAVTTACHGASSEAEALAAAPDAARSVLEEQLPAAIGRYFATVNDAEASS